MPLYQSHGWLQDKEDKEEKGVAFQGNHGCGLVQDNNQEKGGNHGSGLVQDKQPNGVAFQGNHGWGLVLHLERKNCISSCNT